MKRGISRTRPRTSVLLFKATKKERNVLFGFLRTGFPRKGRRNPLPPSRHRQTTDQGNRLIEKSNQGKNVVVFQILSSFDRVSSLENHRKPSASRRETVHRQCFVSRSKRIPDTIEVDRGRKETGPGIGRKQNFTRVPLLFCLFFSFPPFAFGESKRRLCALRGESNGSRS